jgi:hypothetical protein
VPVAVAVCLFLAAAARPAPITTDEPVAHIAAADAGDDALARSTRLPAFLAPHAPLTIVVERVVVVATPAAPLPRALSSSHVRSSRGPPEVRSLAS